MADDLQGIPTQTGYRQLYHRPYDAADATDAADAGHGRRPARQGAKKIGSSHLWGRCLYRPQKHTVPITCQAAGLPLPKA